MAVLGALAVAAALVCTSTVSAQPLLRRMQQVKNGTVRLSFAARPDVCGNGRNNISTRNSGSGTNAHRNEWVNECQSGPVRVALDVADGFVVAVRTYVGGRWGAPGDATDLGTVGVKDAVDYLLDTATRGSGKGATDAIFPASIADSVMVWPRLLQIARDDSRTRAVRSQAVFWVSQAAGEKATEGLAEVAGDVTGDREVRLQAVFALSQRHEEGVPALLNVARTSKDPEIRKRAIFWLGQSKDDRALAYFESVLMKK